MHRTQVLLDEAQYLALKETARRSGRSMGELIRHYVGQGLQHLPKARKPARSSLTALKGIVHDDLLASTHHDELLYGEE